MIQCLNILRISRRVSHVPTVLIVARFFHDLLDLVLLKKGRSKKENRKRTAKQKYACNISTGDHTKQRRLHKTGYIINNHLNHKLRNSVVGQGC